MSKNIFSGKTDATNDVEEDYIGGGGFFETDTYPAILKTMYDGKSQSTEAKSINIIFDIDGHEFKTQIWVSNRTGSFTYKDKKSGKPVNLPGYNLVSSLPLLTIGKELGDLDVEEMTVKLYDYEAKREIPQQVRCYPELHGVKVMIAIQKQLVDKTAKSDSTGNYEVVIDDDGNPQSKNTNELIKFFAPEKLATISEVKQFVQSLGGNYGKLLDKGKLMKAISKMEDESGTYIQTWLDRNKGKTYDKTTGKKSEGKSFGSGKNSKKSSTKSQLFDDDDE